MDLAKYDGSEQMEVIVAGVTDCLNVIHDALGSLVALASESGDEEVPLPGYSIEELYAAAEILGLSGLYGAGLPMVTGVYENLISEEAATDTAAVINSFLSGAGLMLDRMGITFVDVGKIGKMEPEEFLVDYHNSLMNYVKA